VPRHKNDAAAVATNFTENGILVTPNGTIFGQESIEKYYADLFKEIHLSNNLAPVDEDSPQIIGTDGKEDVGNRKMECDCQRPELWSCRSQRLLVSDS
jgi:hypothetical protein